MTFKSFVGEFLSFLERKEEKLLSWGFYNGSFDETEIEDLFAEAPGELRDAWQQFASQGYDLREVIEQLCVDRLLHELPGRPDKFRTRFGEGVRLLAGLRQLFPNRPWATAPRLISDIRIDLAPRSYPKRENTAEECWNDVAPLSALTRTDLLRQAFLALASRPDGQELRFASFQRRAFVHLFGAYGREGVNGSVVSAGTGSGKTKAFYIPAFLRIVDEIAQGRPAYTKVIAIYPRNVLLADQLREALSEAAKLRAVLDHHGLRSLTFGALLGDTPYDGDFSRAADNGRLRVEQKHWNRKAMGFSVPFLKSPSRPRNDVVWRDSDRLAGRTCLFDETHPQDAEIPDHALRLTRQQLQRDPPDVLFISAEMLNREMGNSEWSRTLGLGRGPLAPRLVLLDEVHAYQGIQGAQIAWLLRRWKHWSKARSLHVVGLSATLRDASGHLGRVAGILPQSVMEFHPEPRELTYEGIEYNVAIKGNPAGASLLATSIQTGMLLTRLLTPPNVPDAGPDDVHGNAFFGRKVFGFTDNLDTLNRWLGDMIDAERKHLAALRLEGAGMTSVQRDRMYADGQLWQLCMDIGHNLSRQLRVSGCSSQRPGVNAASDLIIATSSLEVGFDDPEVGVILHHKRPSSISSFLQRKGRAGRRIGMRPWTVAVLSDYGGDRYMFQNAERLFRPEIDSIFLPIRNPYVLRLQAVYFLLDWLGQEVRSGSPFSYLRPGIAPREAREASLELLRGIVQQGSLWLKFRQDFDKLFGRPGGPGDLGLSEAELDAILWNEPRPLLVEVVPALIRKLEAEWAYADPLLSAQREDAGTTRPLPDFIPPATFGQLDLAELTLAFPDTGKDDEPLAVSQGLYEFCPGRASKRYSIETNERAYWLRGSERLLNAAGQCRIAVRDCFRTLLLLDRVTSTVEDRSAPVLVYQPLTGDVLPLPKHVNERSNAQWDWETRFRLTGQALDLPLPRSAPWSVAVTQFGAWLHRELAGIEVLRFAHGWKYTISMTQPPGQTLKGNGSFWSGDDTGTVAEAVGFRHVVDGVRIVISARHLADLPELKGHEIDRLRADYFLNCLRTCPTLAPSVDFFSAEWLHRTSLAMLTAAAIRQHCRTLREAQDLLTDREHAAREILDDILPVAVDGDDGTETPAKLRDNILGLWSDPAISRRVAELEACLWEQPGSEFQDWNRRRYLAALAQAFRSGAVARLEGVSEDDLMVDVVWEGQGDAEIYLTETNSGGLGHIEAIVAEIRRAPELFPEGARHALTYCPRHNTTSALLAALTHVAMEPADGRLRRGFEHVREASDFRHLAEAGEDLKQALWDAGLDSGRSVFVALVSHFLRPGSSRQTDLLTYFLHKAWRKYSHKFAVPIDPNVWAYLCASYEPLRRRFSAALMGLSGGQEVSAAQLYRIVRQTLLEGCEHACPECLDDRNPYNDAGQPSRALARQWFAVEPREVRFEDEPSWRDAIRQRLREYRSINFRAGNLHIAEALAEVQVLLAEELEVGFLLVPPSLVALRRAGTDWVMSLELRGLVA